MKNPDFLFLELYIHNPRRVLPVFPIATIHKQAPMGPEYTVLNDDTRYLGNVLYEETIPRVSNDGLIQATQLLAQRYAPREPLDVAYTHKEESTTVRFIQRTKKRLQQVIPEGTNLLGTQGLFRLGEEVFSGEVAVFNARSPWVGVTEQYMGYIDDSSRVTYISRQD
ncbi:MAG: hypothetical protein ACMXYD_03840 [Candidatus Woesearchaeota archaeon]